MLASPTIVSGSAIRDGHIGKLRWANWAISRFSQGAAISQRLRDRQLGAITQIALRLWGSIRYPSDS